MRPNSIDSLQPYLRHSFASRALALDETLPVIGKLLGHSDIETAARYAHLVHDSIHETAERIAESIAAGILYQRRRPSCTGICPAVENIGLFDCEAARPEGAERNFGLRRLNPLVSRAPLLAIQPA